MNTKLEIVCWTLVALGILAFLFGACREDSRSSRERGQRELELKRACIQSGGDLIEGNCIRRAAK